MSQIDSFDYVVVGGGTAGALIASRLSEGSATVCLLEAGPRDLNPLIHIPAGYIKNVYSKALTWGFESEPSAGTANRRFSIPQGKVLGGSSSINGLNYNRGQKFDYDHWAELGNVGWSFDDVLPFFRKSERRVGAADEHYRGRSGEMPITDLDWHHPILDAFVDGVTGMGIPRNKDYNAGSQEGVGFFQRTIENGRRVSSAKAFLDPARKRSNLEIRTNCQATEIVLEGRIATAVKYTNGDRTAAKLVKARREVIITAGTVNSAKLLQLSGIGPGGLLARHGIPVVHELPGVGQNFRDHYAVRMVSRLRNTRTINNMAQGFPLIFEIVRWLMGRPSLLAVSPSLAHVFWKSEPSANRPDLQFVFTPASFREGVVGLLDKQAGMTCGVWQERPESVGYVEIASKNPFERPVLQPNYLSDETDRKVLVQGMKLARSFMQTPALAKYFDQETAPGVEVNRDDELLDYARQNGITVYHLIGTCRMGPSADGGNVVDPTLKVHGLDRLRVADASIMPTMPSANTNAATLMIAEKAADMIARGS